MSGQLDLLDAVEPAQQEAAGDPGGLEARFRTVWAAAERSGSTAAEAEAWRLADLVGARTGEGRLVLPDRLVPDEPAPAFAAPASTTVGRVWR